jgi:hypothetical protein
MDLSRLFKPRGPLKSYAPRQDAETGGMHMRVPDAVDYERQRVTTAWRRKVGNGTLTCEVLRGHKRSRRLVQLVAEYEDAGDAALRTCICDDELDEARQVQRLEKLMLEAAARPSKYDVDRGLAIADALESGRPLEDLLGPSDVPASPQDE